MFHKTMVRGLLAAALLASAVAARADWTYTSLHPPGALNSMAFGTTDTEQVGFVDGQAARWSGIAGSYIDLTPLTASSSGANATGGGQQAGYAYFGGGRRAGYWSGTPATWVNINPALSVNSEVRGTTGTQQVGVVTHLVGAYGVAQASLWLGDALSWRNLNPLGATTSVAESTTGAQQAGGANFGDIIYGSWQAGIWSGFSSTWVSLHPSSADQSYAYSTSGTLQAGNTLDAGATHAALWSGTAASYVNLHPSGAFDSVAYSTSDAHQVGWATYPDTPGMQAVIWSGTAGSVFNLQSVLPSDFATSEAHSIFESGGTIYVAGFADKTLGGREAILWTRTIPEPSTLALLGVGAVGLLAYAWRRRKAV